jgi:hypothetical protein
MGIVPQRLFEQQHFVDHQQHDIIVQAKAQANLRSAQHFH